MPGFLHDNRLDESDTYYRMWHDMFDAMLPPGQSTTNKLVKEIIPTNVRTNGKIKKGFFNKPLVEYLNTLNPTREFDRFYLQTWRPNDDRFPNDDPDIDYYHDLGLRAVWGRINAVFTSGGITGRYVHDCHFLYRDDGMWNTETLQANEYSLQNLIVDFYMTTKNPAINQGLYLNTGLFLQDTNLPIYTVVEGAKIKNGNSSMDILLRNSEFPISLSSFSIEILGGE